MPSIKETLPACPKCGATMTFLVEKERSNGTTKVTRYYKCPVCGTKVIFEQFLVRRVDGVIRITWLTNGNPKIIYGTLRRAPRPRKNARKPRRK